MANKRFFSLIYKTIHINKIKFGTLLGTPFFIPSPVNAHFLTCYGLIQKRARARRKLRAYQRHITFYPAGIHYVITNGNQYKNRGIYEISCDVGMVRQMDCYLSGYPSSPDLEIRKHSVTPLTYSVSCGDGVHYGACCQTHRQTVLLSCTARRKKILTSAVCEVCQR